MYGHDEDEMIGNQNKKLIKNEPLKMIEEKEVGKNDISIMAGLFEEANKEYSEGEDEDEIQVVDIMNDEIKPTKTKLLPPPKKSRKEDV